MERSQLFAVFQPDVAIVVMCIFAGLSHAQSVPLQAPVTPWVVSPSSSSGLLKPATNDASGPSAANSATLQTTSGQAHDSFLTEGTILRVALGKLPNFSRVHSGDELEGQLAGPVYQENDEVVPARSRVRFVIDKVERKRPQSRSLLARGVKLLCGPENWKRDFGMSFRSASLISPNGAVVKMEVFFLGITRTSLVRGVDTKGGPSKQSSGHEKTTGLQSQMQPPRVSTTSGSQPSEKRNILTVRLEHDAVFPALVGAPSDLAASDGRLLATGPFTIAAGTHARLMLMRALSASENRAGDTFEARLMEPVHAGPEAVLPAGSLFKGHIGSLVPPRRLSRPASLYLTFTKLILPSGAEAAISTSLVSSEVEQGSHAKMDSEGALHGGGRGRDAVLFDLGMAAGIAKITDDSVQLLLELLMSGATDASTAGTARYAAAAASVLFLAARHGRNVLLPKYTEMDLSFDRPVAFVDAPRAKEH